MSWSITITHGKTLNKLIDAFVLGQPMVKLNKLIDAFVIGQPMVKLSTNLLIHL
jgi:hypothetical protein